MVSTVKLVRASLCITRMEYLSIFVQGSGPLLFTMMYFIVSCVALTRWEETVVIEIGTHIVSQDIDGNVKDIEKQKKAEFIIVQDFTNCYIQRQFRYNES